MESKSAADNSVLPLTCRGTNAPSVLINAGSAVFGRESGRFTVIAGPCAVESHAQILEAARAVKAAGASVLRGGAWKPRTSPYSFQGLGREALSMLADAKKETGLPIVTELVSVRHLDFYEDVDIIQIGARNMQNFDLLKEAARAGKPVLLKRGHASTVSELLHSAEHIMAAGNSRLILCERGIRTFDSFTRSTLDLAVIPYLREKTRLPLIVDPCHAAGKREMAAALCKAACAAGADGIMVEVHPDPPAALCDGSQSLSTAAFADLMTALAPYAALEGREI